MLPILKSYVVKDAIENLKTGVAQYNLSLEQIRNFEIPLPPSEIQSQLVDEIESLENEMQNKKEEIKDIERKLNNKIAQVWGVKEEETLSMAAEPKAEYNK